MSASRELEQRHLTADPPAMSAHEDSENELFSAVGEHLWCELNGEAVILSLKNGKYYGMNAIGAEIWKYLQSPTRVCKIQKKILADYDVDPEECLIEIKEFIDSMLKEGLIEVSNVSTQKICGTAESGKDTIF
ncbi:MAG: PqqD family protein [Pyrinomonadaceae bacterium]|nr:PqqD family protein [Pyrinomonadaceae bacterium]